MHHGTPRRVREAVFAEVETTAFQKQFERLQRLEPSLARYGGAMEVLAVLHDTESPNYEANDAILLALIRAAQAPVPCRRAACALLLAALMPAMTRIRKRIGALVPPDQDSFAEVYWAFLQEVAGWNPRKTNKVALNLRMNTEKRVRRRLQDETAVRSAASAAQEWLDEVEITARLAHRAAKEEPFEDGDRQAMVEVVRTLVDEDVLLLEESLLVVGHAVYGRPLRELAEEQHLNYKAACRRYERAVQRIRARLGQSRDSLSPFGRSAALPR